MHEVFISYRRGDSVAEDVRDFLERALYSGAVFYDVFDLTAGDYRPEIEAAIRSSKVVVVVVGRVWQLRGEELERASDVVRQEILTAIDARVKLVPLLFGQSDLGGLSLPGEIRSALGEANSIYLELRERRQMEAVLRRRLLPLILPHLPGYWRQRAWSWRSQAVFAGGSALILLAMIAWVFASGLDVAEIQRRAFVRRAFYGPVALKTSNATSYLDERPTDTPGNSAADRQHQMLDQWIDRINHDVEAPRPNRPASRLLVASYDFDRHYQTFPGWVTIGNEDLKVNITEVYAFLVRNDGPSATYRPVYRQLSTVRDPRQLVQVREKDSTAALTSIPVTVTIPDPGERLLLLIVVEKSQPSWPKPDDYRLTLEVN